jgi:hypothetical protein
MNYSPWTALKHPPTALDSGPLLQLRSQPRFWLWERSHQSVPATLTDLSERLTPLVAPLVRFMSTQLLVATSDCGLQNGLFFRCRNL